MGFSEEHIPSVLCNLSNGEGGIKDLILLCVVDELLGAVNQMLTQEKWSCVCRGEEAEQAERRLLL